MSHNFWEVMTAGTMFFSWSLYPTGKDRQQTERQKTAVVMGLGADPSAERQGKRAHSSLSLGRQYLFLEHAQSVNKSG